MKCEWGWEVEKLNRFNGIGCSFFGKKLGIMGVDDSGKSTLRKLIVDCELDKNVEPTSVLARNRRLIIKVKNTNQKIAFSYIDDTAGDRDNLKVKKKVYKKVDRVIYFVRSEYIIPLDEFVDNSKKDRYIAALKNDFKHLDEWGKKQIIIVANYFGVLPGDDMVNVNPSECKVPNFSDRNVSRNYKRDFKPKLKKIIDNSEAAKEAKWIVGSLVSGQFANQLVLNILECLM